MTAGLDFWATDAVTDSQLPLFDDWSITFLLREFTREVNRDWMLEMLRKATAVDTVENRWRWTSWTAQK